jgi:hypothetical protein
MLRVWSGIFCSPGELGWCLRNFVVKRTLRSMTKEYQMDTSRAEEKADPDE